MIKKTAKSLYERDVLTVSNTAGNCCNIKALSSEEL